MKIQLILISLGLLYSCNMVSSKTEVDENQFFNDKTHLLKKWHSFEKCLKTPESVYNMKIYKLEIEYPFIEPKEDVYPYCIGSFINLRRLFMSEIDADVVVAGKHQSIYEESDSIQRLVDFKFEKKIDDLLKYVGTLEQLEELDLSSNKLSNLPAAFANLKNLRILNLSNNQLKKFPEVLTQLPKLRVLYLDFNRIVELPASIAQLPNLEVLSLRNNPIKKLPDTITDLTELEYLDASYSQLTTLPTNMGKMKNLVQLDLSYERLDSLPQSLKQLPYWKSLDIPSSLLNNF